MKFKRHYLTSEEINYVVNEVIAQDTAFEREIIKIALIAQMLIDDTQIKAFDTTNEIYDYLLEQDINMYIEVNNMDTVDNLINEELGVNTTIKQFVSSLSVKIDEYAQNVNAENLSNIIDEFKKISEQQD